MRMNRLKFTQICDMLHKFVTCHTNLWHVTQIKTWHRCDTTRVCLDLCDASRNLYEWVMSRISIRHVFESCLNFGCVMQYKSCICLDLSYATFLYVLRYVFMWHSGICHVTHSCDVLIRVTCRIHVTFLYMSRYSFIVSICHMRRSYTCYVTYSCDILNPKL